MATSRKGFYGWWALVGAMLVYFCGCCCCFYSIGVFIPVLCVELHSSLVAVTGVITLFMVLMGVVGPLIGFSIARFGARKNIIIGNLVTALGLAGIYFVNETWQLYLFFGVLVGLGQGFGMFIPATTIANNWFMKRRSLAISLIVAAGAIGGFAGPSLTNMLISSVGWRLAWVFLGGILLVLSVIIGGLLIRNRPEDMGQVPDGMVGVAVEESSVAPSRVYQTPIDWKTGDALRTPAIWLMVAVMAVQMFALSTMTGHLVNYLENDLLFPGAIAAFVLGLLPGMSIIGRLGTGFLAMRFEVRHLAAIYLGLMIIAMAILMTTTSLAMIYLFAALLGIGYGAIIPALPTLIGAYYGRTSYAQIIGWTMPITTIIGATAAPLAGIVREATGSYTLWFIIVTALLGVGLVLSFFARPPKPKDLP